MTNTVQPNAALRELMAREPGAEEEYIQLPDRVRDLFNVWALLSPEKRDLVAAEILQGADREEVRV